MKGVSDIVELLGLNDDARRARATPAGRGRRARRRRHADELERMIVEREQEMFAAAEELRFELAARLRDEIADLRREQLQRLQGAGGDGEGGLRSGRGRRAAAARRRCRARSRARRAAGEAAAVSDDRARDEDGLPVARRARVSTRTTSSLAMHGPAGAEPLLGRGAPLGAAGRPRRWCEESERRRRHEELLRKWERPSGG